MQPYQIFLTVFVLLCIVAVGYAFVYTEHDLLKTPFLDKHLLTRGTMDRPPLWIFYPSSEVTARNWYDFGARSSRALNMPLLNLCYQSIAENNHNEYYVRVISGLSGLAELLGEDALPSGLRRHGDLSSIQSAEMNWIRAAVLAKFGGLWVDPSTICLKGFGKLPKEKVVFFGTDLNETYGGEKGTVIPGHHAMWVPRAGHPMMEEWASVCYERIDHKRGGEQIRRDFAWDFVRFSSEYAKEGIMIDPHSELTRRANGKRLQLEDWFATGAPTFDIPPHVVFVTLPWNELQDRQLFGWALRMSERQLMDSDLTIKYLFQMSKQLRSTDA